MNKYRKALKNYTTQASIDKMVTDIQDIILDFGGSGIIMDYDSNRFIKTLLFKIETPNGTKVVNIPFMVEKTKGVLKKQGALKGREANSDIHAYRVTLANIRDWLDAQLAIYATEMFEFAQIFLPYIQDKNGKTAYEFYKDNNFAIGLEE